MAESRKPLLRQSSELKADRVWNWTLPAFAVRLTDGRTMNVCPKAGACASFCYALANTYMFHNVRGAHERNLAYVLDHLEDWQAEMTAELARKKLRPTRVARFPDRDLQLDDWAEAWRIAGGVAVRIHDSGDFFSVEYLQAWLKIAAAHRDILFYAYTKDVKMFRAHVVGKAPVNFRWVYSMGGKEDGLIDKDQERHADVFQSFEDMERLGYTSQDESDLLCVLLPTTRIGIPANNIVHFNKKIAGRSFSELEQDRQAQVAEKRQRAQELEA